jgi:hypothetical protein
MRTLLLGQVTLSAEAKHTRRNVLTRDTATRLTVRGGRVAPGVAPLSGVVSRSARHAKFTLRLAGGSIARFFFVILLLVLATPLVASETIQLERRGGAYVVPVRINEAITLPFILDTSSADVAIPADVFSTLLRTGTVKTRDFLGAGVYRLADGSETPSERFVLHELGVGRYVVRDVIANVVPEKGDPLLGQSFLSKLPEWEIDNARHVLFLGSGSRPADGREGTTTMVPTPSPQQATPPNRIAAFRAWPPVGAWAVSLSPLPSGSAVCGAMTRVPPYGPAGYTMAFSIGRVTTHFCLYNDGPMIPNPQGLTLSVDGRQIATLPILGHTTVETGKSFSIMADVPGDMLSRVILPAMVDSTTLAVTAGQHVYPMPIIDYKRVTDEIVQCADAFRATYR